jgi:hypothetical protein
MEPISELGTVITSHLWLLHDLFPDEGSVVAILGMNWHDALEEQAAYDYSRVQALLDLTLTDKITEGDWDPKDPLGTFRRPEPQPENLNLLERLERWKLERGQSPRAKSVRRDKLQQARVDAVAAALDVLGKRVAAMVDQGLARGLDDLSGLWPTGLSSGQANYPRPRFLTREALFERIAGWLFAAPLETVSRLATAFISADGFLMQEEIDRCGNGISTRAQSPRSALAKTWTGMSAQEKTDLLLDVNRLRDVCCKLNVPVPFSMILRDELSEIELSRLVRLNGQNPNKLNPNNPPPISGVNTGPGVPQHRAFQSCLCGLALSGGGIRSATFALGLLQGMADRNVLPYIDLVSTVSGGGYIGSWLIAWIKRRGSVASVQQSLRGCASTLHLSPDCPVRRPEDAARDLTDNLNTVTHNSDPRSDHVRPIRLLREYARYLAPQAGFLSPDTWTIVATWFRNTLLNLSVLTLFWGAALLLPRIVIFLLLHARIVAAHDWTPGRRLVEFFGFHDTMAWNIFFAIVIASFPLLAGCLLIGIRNLKTFGPYGRKKNQISRGDDDAGVVGGIIPWILLGAFLEVTMLWSYLGVRPKLAQWAALAFGLVVVGGIFILAESTGKWDSSGGPSGRWQPSLAKPIQIIAAIFSAVAGSALIYWVSSKLNQFGANTERGLWMAGSIGIALMLLTTVCVAGIFLGLSGKALSDEQREWWSRLGAWFGLAIGGWLIICAICFFMPLWIAMLGLKMAALGVGWASITAAGIKIAFSPKSGGNGEIAEKWYYRLVLNLAPAVFMLGVLSAVSFALFWGVQHFISMWPSLSGNSVAHQLCCTNLPMSFVRMEQNYWPLMYPGSVAPMLLMGILFGFCLLFAWRVDINEFSMHYFYKNRLVRAYLGASRARTHRLPNAFTGFDLEDDIRLYRFQYSDETDPRDLAMDCKASYAGPYPIINTALNITRGEDLGIQERKAESFVFTPLWSGFDFARRQAAAKKTTLSEYAYQQTEQFGEPVHHGALVGTAMAISGAAFSSNAGFHTSPSLAFLLTVFGVRLGWWAGNPRGEQWGRSSPTFGLFWLIKELTANTSTAENFVLLSDGGHFENMGLYELIRRRCRYIILSDAEEDEHFKLEGIGGAIRKCRDDFGVVIDLNLDALQPIGDPGVSRLHYSLGTIIYPGETNCGQLVYIKSSVTGDEPVDVIEFRKRHSEFPHTSTANQFFDESHFESYRALGHHIASEVFSQDMPELPLPGPACQHLKALFDRIQDDWRKRITSSKKKGADESLKSVLQKPDSEGETK